MTKEEIVNLSVLSRIALSDEETERLPNEIAIILDYVSDVQKIVDSDKVTSKTTSRYNVLRKDIVTHESGLETERLLNASPRRQGNYLVVNKILQQDE